MSIAYCQGCAGINADSGQISTAHPGQHGKSIEKGSVNIEILFFCVPLFIAENEIYRYGDKCYKNPKNIDIVRIIGISLEIHYRSFICSNQIENKIIGESNNYRPDCQQN